ncbi:MAG: ATP-binding protein [Legionellaceae bacterium]|nr:ATP-binding protein [Legionellaceae bacterium]
MKRIFVIFFKLIIFYYASNVFASEECEVSHIDGDYYADTKKIINDQLNERKSLTPQFIITFGPPGSGKSSIVQKFLTKYNINPKSVVSVNVDDIIMQMPCYKFYRAKIKKLTANNSSSEIRNNLKKNNNEFLNNLLKAPSKDDLKKIGALELQKELNESLYFYYRGKLHANDISMEMRELATLKKLNIVWETTGTKVSWTIKVIREMIKQGYHITVLYPFADLQNIIKRVSVRNKTTGQEGARDEIIKESFVKSQHNLKFLLPLVDEFILYNSNGAINELAVMMKLTYSFTYTPELEEQWDKMGNYILSPGVLITPYCRCDLISRDEKYFQPELKQLVKKYCGKCST